VNNLRQLEDCWAMYKDDANDVLIPNSPGTFSQATWTSGYAEGGVSYWPIPQAVLPGSAVFTDGGGIWQSAWVYHCPGDKVPSANGQRFGVTR